MAYQNRGMQSTGSVHVYKLKIPINNLLRLQGGQILIRKLRDFAR